MTGFYILGSDIFTIIFKMKMTKLSLMSFLAFLAYFFSFGLRTALAAPVMFTANSTLTLTSPAIALTALAGSLADLVTVNAGNIVVNMSASTGGSFTLTSPQAMTVSGGSISQSCSLGIETETITQPSGSATYTLTPTGSQCIAQAAVVVTPAPVPLTIGIAPPVSSNGTTPSPALTAPPFPPSIAVAPPSIANLQNTINTLTIQLNALRAQVEARNLASLATGATTFVFTRDLQLHDSGGDVQALQILLNDQGFTVSQTGPGSPGNETFYFGMKTLQALVKFQNSAGIIPARGNFGPITRAYVKNLLH